MILLFCRSSFYCKAIQLNNSNDIDTISIANYVESTKNSHEKLLRKFGSDANRALSLPAPKFEIKEAESNEYGNQFIKGKYLNTKAERFNS